MPKQNQTSSTQSVDERFERRDRLRRHRRYQDLRNALAVSAIVSGFFIAIIYLGFYA